MREVHNRSNDAGTCGNGHTDEILLAGTTGIGGLWVHGDIEAGKTAGTCDEKKKAGDGTEARQQGCHIGPRKFGGDLVKSPTPCEQSWCNTEGDHVGQGVELAAKIAGGAGHARDSAVEPIEEDREADGFGGIVEVPGLEHWILSRVGNGILN